MVVMGGCPWIVQDGLGNFGVRGYSDTGVVMGGHPWIVQDGLGNFGVRGYSNTGLQLDLLPLLASTMLSLHSPM